MDVLKSGSFKLYYMDDYIVRTFKTNDIQLPIDENIIDYIRGIDEVHIKNTSIFYKDNPIVHHNGDKFYWSPMTRKYVKTEGDYIITTDDFKHFEVKIGTIRLGTLNYEITKKANPIVGLFRGRNDIITHKPLYGLTLSAQLIIPVRKNIKSVTEFIYDGEKIRMTTIASKRGVHAVECMPEEFDECIVKPWKYEVNRILTIKNKKVGLIKPRTNYKEYLIVINNKIVRANRFTGEWFTTKRRGQGVLEL